jgi:hypothetical protein
MAAIAHLRQLNEGLDEAVAALGVDRPAQIRKGRLALLLDQLSERNPLELGIKACRRVKALLDEPQFETGE